MTAASSAPGAFLRVQDVAHPDAAIPSDTANVYFNRTSGLIQARVNSRGVFYDGLPVNTTKTELDALNGTTATSGELNVTHGLTGSVMQVLEYTFTETSGAGTYTSTTILPAGATIHDIIINGVALWDNAGACTLKVGDTGDDDGFYTGVDLKATDLLAGESLSFSLAGGKAGAYIANSQVSPRYSATARIISGVITTASTGGSAGRTRMTVVFSAPQSGYITAATKV